MNEKKPTTEKKAESEAEILIRQTIREERTARSWSQGQCARAMGISRTSFTMIENGVRKITALELAALCEAWQLPYERLFCPRTATSQVNSGVQRTERGFEYVDFTDSNGESCSIQISSALDYTGGLYKLWLGCNRIRVKKWVENAADGEHWQEIELPERIVGNNRMHLSYNDAIRVRDALNAYIQSNGRHLASRGTGSGNDTDGKMPLGEFLAQKAKERQELERLQAIEQGAKRLMVTWGEALKKLGLSCYVPLHIPFEHLGKALGWMDEEPSVLVPAPLTEATIKVDDPQVQEKTTEE